MRALRARNDLFLLNITTHFGVPPKSIFPQDAKADDTKIPDAIDDDDMTLADYGKRVREAELAGRGARQRGGSSSSSGPAPQPQRGVKRGDDEAEQLNPLRPDLQQNEVFDGELIGNIQKVSLVDNLLAEAQGHLTWKNAALQTPIPTSLGTVEVDIKPQGENAHVVTVKAAGGDVAMDGTVTLSLNGDFNANVLFTPAQSASAAVRNGLRQMGRADAQGRVRFQRTGNVNRLM